MTDMNDIDIEEGRRLAEVATAAEWHLGADLNAESGDPDVDVCNATEVTGPGKWVDVIDDAAPDGSYRTFESGMVADCGNYFGWPDAQNLANATLIVWLRNNAAAMFDAIESGRQWETIARQAQEDAEAGWKWAWRFDQWFGNSATSELNDEERAEFQADLQRHEDYDPIDDLADRTPTPTDGA